MEPTIITGLKHDAPIVLKETFVPIVYAVKFSVSRAKLVKGNVHSDIFFNFQQKYKKYEEFFFKK